ncbi:hypothetical protein CLOM_g13828 [Closterium sp. NIES-68]|nr:hypothetical protein CLOM_g13828 [Closterium sp. NIES-68]GJP78460.1 hypothetical protein CLOP_g8754 [Closterium sp. NIES-67]
MDVDPVAQIRNQEDRTAIERESIGGLRVQFAHWKQQLEDGFSLLFFGLGSKNALLTAFATECLADKTVVTVNGADTNTSPARIAATIASSCQSDTSVKVRKGPATSSTSAAELARWTADLVTEKQQQHRKLHPTPKQQQKARGGEDKRNREGSPWLCVVVHNLDAPPLRASPDCVALLALLAACPAIALIASVDHVLSSALFDRQTLSLFNFSTHHVMTRGAYTNESSAFAQASLSHAPSASAAAQAALLVLRSLPPNACQIFTLISRPGSDAGGGGDRADEVAESSQRNQPQALPFAQLYSLCRARFLVTSEVTLRAHLREFEDHALVKIFRQPDGTESVGLVLPVAALQQMMLELGQA